MNDKHSSYDPGRIEQEIYDRWDSSGAFHDEPDDRTPYCIVIPPPNVTGALHMGHALNNTIQDVLIRFYRMQGYNTLWLPGTDHAGVATQSVVESTPPLSSGIYELKFDLIPVANLFNAGHRIRIAITGADADNSYVEVISPAPVVTLSRNQRYPSHVIYELRRRTPPSVLWRRAGGSCRALEGLRGWLGSSGWLKRLR